MTSLVPFGSWAVEKWDAWLQAEGFPPLERIGRRVEGGFEMPITVAPPAEDKIGHHIALRWASWLRSKA